MTVERYQVAVLIKPIVAPSRVVVTVAAESPEEAQEKAVRLALSVNPDHIAVGGTNLGVKK